MSAMVFLVSSVSNFVCTPTFSPSIVYMKLLDLFSGTGSVAKVARELGYEVTTLDLSGADINTDILIWDYTQYPVGYFDVVWSSPPCQFFSCARRSNIGRYGITSESIERDIVEYGIPILRKTEEIIDYFKPTYWYIENPATGRMKDYITLKPYIIDYCRYGDIARKRTAIWTNITNFTPKLCNKACGSFDITNNRHISSATGGSSKQKGRGSGSSKNTRYAIPPILITELLTACNN